MKLLKTETPGLYKDVRSGAVINTNTSEYNRLVISRQKAREAEEMAEKMCSLEAELRELKQLLAQVINGKQNV